MRTMLVTAACMAAIVGRPIAAQAQYYYPYPYYPPFYPRYAYPYYRPPVIYAVPPPMFYAPPPVYAAPARRTTHSRRRTRRLVHRAGVSPRYNPLNPLAPAPSSGRFPLERSPN